MLRLMIYKTCITLMTRIYGNYGIFLIMGTAGFVSSTVEFQATDSEDCSCRASQRAFFLVLCLGFRV